MYDNNILTIFFAFLFRPSNWSGSFRLNDFDGWQEKGFRIFYSFDSCLASESKATFEKFFFGTLTFVKNKTRKQTPFSVAFGWTFFDKEANYCAEMVEAYENELVMRVRRFEFKGSMKHWFLSWNSFSRFARFRFLWCSLERCRCLYSLCTKATKSAKSL